MTILAALIQTYAEWRRHRGKIDHLKPRAKTQPSGSR